MCIRDRLLSDPKIQIPMSLLLNIQCFDKDLLGSYYFSRYWPVDAEGTYKRLSGENPKDKPFKIPYSEGEFALYNNPNLSLENMVATVRFNNASVLSPVLDVKLTGKSLCEASANYPAISGDTLKSEIYFFADKYDEHSYSMQKKSVYDLVRKINATEDSKVIRDIGNTLMEVFDQSEQPIKSIVIDILESVERWTVSEADHAEKQLIQYLDLASTEINDNPLYEDSERKSEIARVGTQINTAINKLQPEVTECQTSEQDVQINSRKYAECLDKYRRPERPNPKLEIEFQIASMHRVLIEDSRLADTYKDQLIDIAFSLRESGEKLTTRHISMDEDVRQNSGDNFTADSLWMSALAYSLAGQWKDAEETLSNVRGDVDSVVDQRFVAAFLDHGGGNEINTQFLQLLLGNEIRDFKADAELGSTPQKMLEDIRSTYNILTERNWHIQVVAGVVFEEAQRIAQLIKGSFAGSLSSISDEFPILLDDSGIVQIKEAKIEGSVGVKGSSNELYNVIVKASKTRDMFDEALFCRIYDGLVDLNQPLPDLVPAGHGAPNC